MNCVEYGTASRVVPGQTDSGDLHLVCPTPAGTLVAAVDGLGHGQEAAAAAQMAVAFLRENASEHPIWLVRHCHDALRTMRGVVISLAAFNSEQAMVTWIGVGNVAGLLFRGEGQPLQETLLLRAGVVGGQLPPLQAAVLPVGRGDTLIFYTDGVRDGFVQDLNLHAPPQSLADWIMARYAKGNDDALVLAVRYTGASQFVHTLGASHA